MTTKWIAIGAFWAAVGVGLGAFGAHGLKKLVTTTRPSGAVFNQKVLP